MGVSSVGRAGFRVRLRSYRADAAPAMLLDLSRVADHAPERRDGSLLKIRREDTYYKICPRGSKKQTRCKPLRRTKVCVGTPRERGGL